MPPCASGQHYPVTLLQVDENSGTGGRIRSEQVDENLRRRHAGKTLRGLPDQITWTTRVRSNAALHEIAPPKTGRPGRPRTKGDKLDSLAELARKARFVPTSVTRYGQATEVEVSVITCLWYRVFGSQPVQVVFVQDKQKRGSDIALVTTAVSAIPAVVIERYAARWSIEVAIEDAKQTIGVGQAPNRLQRAAERTVPFGFIVGVLAVCWYATAGHHPHDVKQARAIAPWCRQKAQPSVLDMLAKLRRVIIAAQFRAQGPAPVTPTEINLLRLAWEHVAA